MVSSRLQSWRRGCRRGQSPWSLREAAGRQGPAHPHTALACCWPFKAGLIKQHSVRRARQRLHPHRERSVRTTERTTGTRSYIHRTETAACARCVHAAFLSFSHLDQRVKEQLLETTGRPQAMSWSVLSLITLRSEQCLHTLLLTEPVQCSPAGSSPVKNQQ